MNPSLCRDCPHCLPDETDDGENMWRFCEHPAVFPVHPTLGTRLAMEDEHGNNPPDPLCPLRKE